MVSSSLPEFFISTWDLQRMFSFQAATLVSEIKDDISDT